MELFHEAAEESSRIMDDLRAEVSPLETEQENTSLADRFSRGGLPFRVDPLSKGSGPASYDGRAMKEATAREDTNFAHLNRRMSWTRPEAMKLIFFMLLNSRILVISKDPAQANPLKGWNNAYHGTSEHGIICSVSAHVIEESA